jgi:3-phenylpropionate/cinnamic acid dioxygenase small subunit
VSDSYKAIWKLIHSYADAIDRGDFDQMKDLFANGTWRRYEDPGMSGAEFADNLHSEIIVYDDGTPRTRHLITNVDIDVDEETGTARAQSYATVLQGMTEGELVFVSSIVYQDRFVLADGQWRFAERWLHRGLIGDMSRHAPGVLKSVR